MGQERPSETGRAKGAHRGIRLQMKKKLTVLEQLEGFAEAQIMYADQQEVADLKGNLRKVEADTTVRRELAERILEILDNKED